MKSLFDGTDLYNICLAEKLSQEQEKESGMSCSWSEFVDGDPNMADVLTKYDAQTDADREKFDAEVKRVTSIVNKEMDALSGASQEEKFEFEERIKDLF